MPTGIFEQIMLKGLQEVMVNIKQGLDLEMGSSSSHSQHGKALPLNAMLMQLDYLLIESNGTLFSQLFYWRLVLLQLADCCTTRQPLLSCKEQCIDKDIGLFLQLSGPQP